MRLTRFLLCLVAQNSVELGMLKSKVRPFSLFILFSHAASQATTVGSYLGGWLKQVAVPS